ncbi:extracellular solute-binding protein [Streptomyces sp. WMMC500]|uniref:ABC transporter substrate-binding protein n=1 Tax=Streptomyces sp. WMMC500 TaxID=3015154 RepID=UPI00248C1B1C|nr:extracellular solute-binding protein [Streptomyces sp. WMMC500]WBB58508.1 extracellular solute-binding protein [Streptomyces sp. WMMC500]
MAISRRMLLGHGTALAALPIGGGLLSGCSSGSGEVTADGRQAGALTWWDQYEPVAEVHDRFARSFEKQHPGTAVARQVYNPDQMGQALQLARKSHQLPDITSLAGLEAPGGTPAAGVARLKRDGWFQPLRLSAEARARIPRAGLVEGLNVFDGEIYGMPLFSDRSHSTLNWFDSRLVEQAGGDPDSGPATWDEFRALARRITRAGDNRVWGWIEGVQFTDRLGQRLINLANVAGAAGEWDPATGEYAYADEPFVRALEFFKALRDDKVLFPSSTSLDVRTARSRWASGAAAMFLDGPWNAGVVLGSFPDFMPRMRVGQIPVPDAGTAPLVHVAHGSTQLFVTADSKRPELAAELLGELTGPDYYRGLAEGMDLPPLDLGAVADADVPGVYRRAVRMYAETVRLLPDPTMNNPRIGDVTARMRPVTPDLGQIVQGVLVGALDDPAAALRTYRSDMSAERDRAIRLSRTDGLDASPDDWVFPDWRRGHDYVPGEEGDE